VGSFPRCLPADLSGVRLFSNADSGACPPRVRVPPVFSGGSARAAHVTREVEMSRGGTGGRAGRTFRDRIQLGNHRLGSRSKSEVGGAGRRSRRYRL